ncbi:CDP-alcohol phosphatidyltransferase family protein [Puteibacter caeruleilacunae]|nr:CDP-alcohol phosphatidyltransferase family protein [Puteibacter caeruleilacunae]
MVAEMSIFKQYKASLKLAAVEELVDLFFYRPLAFLFIKSIYRTTITPNQITMIGVLFGVAGGVILSMGNTDLFVYAALLFVIFNVLDCSDGQLARLKGNGTPLGRILDGIADYIVSASAYIGLGIGVANHSNNPLLMWGMIIAAAASNIIHAVLVDYYRNRYLDYALNRKGVLDDGIEEFQQYYNELNKQQGHAIDKLVIGIYLKYSRLQQGLTKTSVQKTVKYDSSLFCQKNKGIMHLWTYLGPATQWTFLIVCVAFNCVNVYLWGLIIAFNTVALILYVVQSRIDRTVQLSAVSVS